MQTQSSTKKLIIMMLRYQYNSDFYVHSENYDSTDYCLENTEKLESSQV